MPTKSVYILLTKHDDIMAKMFNTLTNTHYSHSSIALEDDLDHFYSFVTKDGFYIEHPLKSKNPKKRKRLCQLYKLTVSVEVYNNIVKQIELFKANAKQYKYSYIGLVFCIFRNASFKQENQYFCSQFVSDVLMKTGAIDVQKKSTLFLPDDFQAVSTLECCFEGTIHTLIRKNNRDKISRLFYKYDLI